jgi:RHS repeat-associated protein
VGFLRSFPDRRVRVCFLPGGRRPVLAGGRRWLPGVMAPAVAAAQFLVPVALPVGVAAAVVTGAVARPALARASSGGSVLVLSSSVNGGTSSVEAQDVPSGYTVTVASPSQWDAMTAAQFASYSAIVIGDPSTSSSCAASVPSDALSTAATWGAAVTGNMAVLGTAPVFAGSSGGALVKDALAYAVSGPGTGLYVSLNCEYASAAAGTGVPLLAGVDGGGFTVTGQGSSCPASGSVNTWAAEANSQFAGLAGNPLGPWPAPACAVEETLSSWPTGLSGLAYLPMTAGNGADFTASDGAAGQAYVVVGAAPGSATQALSPSVRGEVSLASMTGGSNPAAPGVASSVTDAGDGVNAADGDFTQSSADVSVPGFGPGLDFTRAYDSQSARQQTVAGVPGPLGYGWTDNWATSLSQGSPAPGDIYTLDGLATDTGDGGPPAAAPLNSPARVVLNGSDIYIVDSSGNRIQEIPGGTKTQWGQPMTTGNMYTIAGSPTGKSGASAAGTAADISRLNDPGGIAFDAAGDLMIADTGNCRVMEIAAADGTQWGQTMSADDLYQIAGRTGACDVGNDNKIATQSDLDSPADVRMDGGNLYITDTGNNRIQEVAASSGTRWGQSMTANDVYTIAGSLSGSNGSSGDGGPAASALLDTPTGLWLNSGDLYIADSGNARVQEVAGSSGSQWAQPMTANDIYTIAGRTGQQGVGNDSKPATQSDLNGPEEIRIDSGNLFIADSGNNRVQEVAGSAHTEWGQAMTQFDVYTVAGSAAGTAGYTGNGGQSASALLSDPQGLALGANGLLIADTGNNEIRRADSSTAVIKDVAGGVGSFGQTGDGGSAVDAGLDLPAGITSDSHGDVFIADGGSGRVQEIAAYTHTQFGISMTAGDVYTVAGSAAGFAGVSGDGGPATSAFFSGTAGIAVDAAGSLYITDIGNNRIQKVSAQTGNISTVAGSATGVSGDSGDGGPATAALLHLPQQVAVDTAGDLFIADSGNNQVREVPAATGNGMTAGDIYTVAGATTGTAGITGDGGPASSALLNFPYGLASDASGDIYIADASNNRIQEIAAASHTQWGQAMTAGHIYTVAGSATGTADNTGDGGPATSARLDFPAYLTVDPSGNLYLADAFNNRYREVAAANGTQWGQAMTAGHIYNVAGSATGASGNSGDGGPATSARLNTPLGIGTDPSGDLFLTDSSNRLREVTATTTSAFPLSPQGTGITITQPGGSQVTYYPQTSGSCTSPYVATGSYCTLPQNVAATLSYNSTTSTYRFAPSPGDTYTYTQGGQFTSEADAAGNTLTAAYNTPAPGTGNCPASASSCTTITAASGRALVLGLNPAGLVTSVTDPMGREWQYSYTNSDLTSATDPMGNTTSYTYGAGSTGSPQLANDLLTITKPNAQPSGPDAGHATVNVYGTSGRVTSQTDPMGFKTTLDYTGLDTSTGTGVVRVGDPDGNTTVYGYAQGAQISQADWTGTTLTSEQDFGPDLTATGTSGGTLLNTWTADGNAKITTYTYDSAGNTTSTTDPLGNTTTSTSTPLGQARCTGTAEAASACSSLQTGPTPAPPGTAITSPASAPPAGVTYTLYDTYGDELWSDTGVYQPGASTASYQQVSYTLYKGNSVTLNGNTTTCTTTPPSPSLPCAKINPDGVVTQLGYNSVGDLTASATPDGNGTEIAKTTYTYDADGEQTSTTSPDGNLSGANAGNYTTTATYNDDGLETSVVQAGGSGATVTPRTTTYDYDHNSNQITVQDPRGHTTATAYNADNQATLVTDADGNATLTCYDGDGNTTQSVPPTGVAGNSLSPASCPVTYPSGYGNRLASDATTFSYDAGGEETLTTEPAPSGQSGYETIGNSYDSAGNITQTTEPPNSSAQGAPNEVTRNTYNAAGALTSVTTGYGTSVSATTSYCYDPDGNRTSVVAADGNTSGTAPCEVSSPWVVSSAAHPAQAAYQTTSSYNSANGLVSTTAPATSAAPNGATMSFTYDPAGNMLTAADPRGITTTWTYTSANLKSSISYSGSSAHSVSNRYDASGNKVAMTDASGSSSYSYNPFGEIISAVNGAGKAVSYSYDANGDTTAITYPLPAGAVWATTSTIGYGYDNAGILNSVTDFSGNQISMASNGDGLPLSETLGRTGDSITTSYDQAGSPSAISLKNSSGTLQSFSYSDAPSGGILAETDSPSSAQSPATYAYDPAGRVASMTIGNSDTLSYSFDASNNLTTLPDGATGQYDHAGELASATRSGITTDYGYDANGERLSAKSGSATVATGAWDGAGALTSYSDSVASMSGAVYDGNGLRVSETITPAGGSQISQRFVWDTVSRSPRLLMDSSYAYIYSSAGAPEEQVNLSTGAAEYIVRDSLGSARGVVSSSGDLAASTSYDAWGNPSQGSGLADYTAFGYAGGYTDPTKLVYLVNRYYDPSTGQFVSVDPALTDTQQPYSYGNGDPVNNNDLNGLSACGSTTYGGWTFHGWGVPAGIFGGCIFGAALHVSGYTAGFQGTFREVCGWHYRWTAAWGGRLRRVWTARYHSGCTWENNGAWGYKWKTNFWYKKAGPFNAQLWATSPSDRVFKLSDISEWVS